LTPQSTDELFRQYRDTQDPRTRQALVEELMPLARSLARRYEHTHEPLDDLVQVASIGLLKAIDRFDPELGVAFSTFAVPTILGELRRHFRDHTWALRVPRSLQELTLRIEPARDLLATRLGRSPTIAELARHLGTGEEPILQALEVSLARHAFPLEPDDDDMPSRSDDGYARAEDRAVLAGLLATLGGRDAEIVFLRFHADLTQDEIATLVGVSQMKVSRTLYRSLVRLREAAEG
jgi:RNA polymerase sigma-B factor